MLKDNDEAQDVAQDVFMRLAREDTIAGDVRKVTAWLYRTATHLAIDRLRRRKLDLPEGAISGGDIEALFSSRQQLAALARRVPAEELELVLVQRLDGLTQAEAGEVLQLSERTVRRRLESFEQRLPALLKEAP